jgi:hypothetical protein
MQTSWPALPLEEWQATRDTVHMWTQIVGKTRLTLTPRLNHWWNSTLYVSARGLTTSFMPDGRAEIEFDFTHHQLVISTTRGTCRQMTLAPRSVADFYAEFRKHLASLDIDAPISTMPNEVPDATPFELDHTHDQYDAGAMHRFWQSLVDAHRVLSQFRAEFRGKASRFISSGARSTWRLPGSPAGPRPATLAAFRTARTG